MIPRETIDRIFATAKIEEVVADYVNLKRRGANLIGLCPFHNEKTGSFTVSPSKGIYKCFGCGASGTALKFIMEIEQCSFVDAVKQLGKKYHIEVVDRELNPEEQQRQDDRESMRVLNEFCNQWFQEQLWESEEGKAIGLAYFRERGLRDDTIRKFQLGYSPEKGASLHKALKQKGFEEKYILNDADTKIGCGVCGKGTDGHLYDRYRDRVIFPLHSVNGKVVGFAGRILKKKENVGKYVNSPDSLLYSKTHQLYGLYQAKQQISKQDMCYLVEGQMDVISMYQSGIENVVASGGTALTKPQIGLIQRFTQNITVLYDGDDAGIHAALRGIDMFLEEGFNVKLVLLPEGEDPDSFAQSHDAAEVLDYFEKNKMDFIRFKASLLERQPSDDPFRRATFIKDIANSISLIPDLLTREMYIHDCADQLQMDAKILTKEVVSIRRKRAEERRKKNEPSESGTTAQTASSEPGAEQTEPTPSVEPDEPAAPKHTSPEPPKDIFEKNYYNLVQLIVRYGEREIDVQQENEATHAQEVVKMQIGDFIIATLEADSIAAPKPIYQRIIDEYKSHCHDTDFQAEPFFKFHPDPEISAMAVDMIIERYELSTMYSHKVVTEHSERQVTDSEENHLDEIMMQMLSEIKLTVVNREIDHVMQEITTTTDAARQRELLEYQTALQKYKSEVCKQLGNRIITI